MNWRVGTNIAVWFLVGVALYSIIKNWGGIWWDAQTWQIVAAIATWLLAGGVVYAFLQVRQARKSTNAQIAVELFKQLRDPKLIEILRSIVYNNNRQAIRGFIDDDTKKEVVSEIEHVIDRFDMLGALVAKEIVDEETAIEAFAGPPALRCWYQLALFTRELQNRRGFYCPYYEDFSRRSLEHFKCKNVEIWLQLKCETKIIPLVKELKEMVERKDELRPRSLKEIERETKS